MNPIDPFTFKSISKANPLRIVFVLRARCEELISRLRFEKYALPTLNGPSPSAVENYDTYDTAVEPEQMALLTSCLEATETLRAPVVEIGAYRGVTTRYLASRTPRPYFAVDPYIGYGGADADMAIMEARTRDLLNVKHLKMTSGQAASDPSLKQVSFVFIDAVHDYVNALFDGMTWARKLEPMGLIAFHDTDSSDFPGVQRAVSKLIGLKEPARLSLFAHTHGTVVLQRVGRI